MHSVSVGQPIQVSEETSHWQEESSGGGKPGDTKAYFRRNYGSILPSTVDGGFEPDSMPAPIITTHSSKVIGSSEPDSGVEDTDPEGDVAPYDSMMQLPMTPGMFFAISSTWTKRKVMD